MQENRIEVVYAKWMPYLAKKRADPLAKATQFFIDRLGFELVNTANYYLMLNVEAKRELYAR
jgi:hypothetical protein